MGKKYLLLCAAAWLTVSSLAIASEVHGLVTYHGLPVPGATVTVTEGGKKSVTVTDTQGFYSVADLADGTATIDVEMTGFAPVKQGVTIAPDLPMGKWDLTLLSLDQMRTALKPVLSEPFTVTQARSEPQKTAEPPKPPAGKTAVTAAAPAPAASEEVADRANDGLLINGSVNNAATSQFSMAPRFGNTASGRSMYSYGFNLRLDTSALDAKTYSLTGTNTTKPNTDQITGGFSVQGPIKIPHLLVHGPTLYVGYQRVENSYANTASGIMPTQDERNGNLSSLTQTIYAPAIGLSAACLGAGVTPGTAFAGNMIPGACMSTAAEQTLQNPNGLLSLYPLPNITSSPQGNYQLALVSDTHSDSVNSYVYKTVGPKNKDQISGSFAASSTRNSNGTLLGFVDASNSLGINSSISWSHTFNAHLRANIGYQFSRQSNRSTPYWQNRANISGLAGVTGNDQDAADYGPPSLNFTSGIAGLSDANSSFTRNETNATSPRLTWNHGQHNASFGFDFRRQEFNYLSQANPRGTFTFTGAATSTTVAGVTSGGSDFADFLLGIPDASAISFGNADKYLRQSVYAGFVNDDWRMSPQVTINAGVHWDYGAPVTELKGRLVNLDVAPGFSAVAPVVASNPVGTLSGQSYPASLLRPDRAGFEPKVGISWRPVAGSSLVIGAGYGLSYDPSVYPGIAQQMANQAELQSPTSKVLTLQNSSTCQLTLANGFATAVNGVNPCPTTSNSSSGTFGVDPNFRVGYVHTWNLRVQRDLPGSLQLLAIYLGNKGTRGAQLFLPNTNPTGAVNPCPSCPTGFEYLASNGNSHRESGQLQLRRRLHNGFTASVLYTFSKSMDDNSSFGGQGAATSGSIAQDWRNLSGERGLSTFDQRHLVSAMVQYTTGMGMGGGTLLSGWRGKLYKEWTVQTQINAGTGLPETPIDSALEVAGYGAFVRPNVTGVSLYAAPVGYYLNPAAYTPPPTGQWGNARRDSITGPNQFSLNATMQRTFRMKDKYTLDLTLTAANALNHVTYTSWQRSITSSQFGLPATANSMRDLNASLRMRF